VTWGGVVPRVGVWVEGYLKNEICLGGWRKKPRSMPGLLLLQEGETVKDELFLVRFGGRPTILGGSKRKGSTLFELAPCLILRPSRQGRDAACDQIRKSLLPTQIWREDVQKVPHQANRVRHLGLRAVGDE
jgi:hypothetical protein